MRQPARRPAASWCQAMLPGSRSPRAREPMTKSCVPARIGATSVAMAARIVGAVAVHEDDDVGVLGSWASAARQARP